MTNINLHPPAIFLMGPTASGKTELAIALYQHLPVEVISVDSVLVYRGMDIGTAKPSSRLLAQVPHRLIDIRDPAKIYSVADFCTDALKEMAEITSSGRIPLLVGGTMLYYKALLTGLSILPSANPLIREKIKKKAAKKGWKTLHDQLKIIDPISALKIHPNDLQRLSRALEVFFISGKTLTELKKKSVNPLPYHTYQFAIAPPRGDLIHQRIKLRYYKMLEWGFEKEVRALFDRDDLHIDLPSIRSVGYRQMWSYLSGEMNYNEMVNRSIFATCQLVKRQMTWLRRWDSVYWLNGGNLNEVLNEILNVIDPWVKMIVYNK